MKKTKAIVITGNGTNCEMEAANACRLAGFDEADIVHISSLLSGNVRLDDYHFLNLTGGFLDGDDLGSAKAQANRFKYAKVDEVKEHLLDQLLRFIADAKPILGVCNGFQLMEVPEPATNTTDRRVTLCLCRSGQSVTGLA